jgi:ribonuclease BN (tRNA processing enzyme)
MEVRFLGSGDAFGSGGRFNTCIYVRGAETVFLLDCGASSLIAMRKFGVDPNEVSTVLITHLHGDHFGGIPFLILDAQLLSRRVAPLTIAGPPGLRARLKDAMETFFPGSSAITQRFRLEVMELEPGVVRVVDRMVVTPYLVTNPSGAPPFALRVEVDHRVLCFSGDTEWTDALAAAARGADLFIAEAYFFEKPVKYHLNYSTLAKHVPQIGAKRVILTHLNADLLARASEIEGEIAHDGLAVTV